MKQCFRLLAAHRLLLLALILAGGNALPAFAATCPDLTGRYAWVGGPNDTGVVVAIQQTACASATAIYDHADGLSFARPMTFDGASHPTFHQGDVVTWESFAWKDGAVTVATEERWPASSGAPPIRFRGRIYLDAAGDLVEEADTLTADGTAVWAHDVEKYRRL